MRERIRRGTLDTSATRILPLLWLVLLCCSPAVSAHRHRIVITCVDGTEPINTTGLQVLGDCDRDRFVNQQCLFGFGPNRRGELREFTVPVNHVRRVHLRGLGRFQLQCLAPDITTQTVACTDGVLTGSIEGPGTTVCDYDRACDGTCSFAFECPLCVFGSPRCEAPCTTCPRFVDLTLPVGSTHDVPLPELHTTLRLTCAPPPPGTACPSVTTSTTLPPDCTTDVDCLRFPEPCRTCIGGRCTEPLPVPPGSTFAGVSCIPNVTTTTLLPATCRDDMDCNIPGTSVPGCSTTVMGCGYCVQ
jgi:hypothetical protein